MAEVILPAGRPLNREMVGAGMGLLGLAGGGTTPQPGEKVFVECPHSGPLSTEGGTSTHNPLR